MAHLLRRHRHRSPSSSHTIRASRLSDKITDTSLFAELVRHKHKKEHELIQLEQTLKADAMKDVSFIYIFTLQ